jgi:hypothetical protein
MVFNATFYKISVAVNGELTSFKECNITLDFSWPSIFSPIYQHDGLKLGQICQRAIFGSKNHHIMLTGKINKQVACFQAVILTGINTLERRHVALFTSGIFSARFHQVKYMGGNCNLYYCWLAYSDWKPLSDHSRHDAPKTWEVRQLGPRY